MPASGAVYQPTTVTYDQQPSESRWHCPMSYFSQRFNSGVNRSRFILWGTFAAGLIILAVGLKLLVDGALGSSTTFLVLGILLLLSGVALIGVFLHMAIRRRGGWATGKGGLGVESGGLGGGGGNGALGASTPSTDPLVAAQYVPVRDAPPSADDERRQLMDNKDCLSSAEESDRMMESDPRILLRPVKNAEDA